MYSPSKSWMATSATAAPPPSSPSPPPPLSKSLIFATSGLGGMMGWCVVHPFNTLAVRSNLASMQGKTFSLKGMIAEHGVMSVYDGLSAGVIRQIFYASSRFGLFETFRDKLHEYRGKTDFASRVAVGAVTGGIAAYISCPAEVATVRMSNDATLPPEQRRNYKSALDTATRIVKEEGVAAFWRGSAPFVNRAMMVGVFQVATLDQFKELYAYQFGQTKNSIPNVFCAAMTSGLVYSIITMPLEGAKNRMASQKADPVTGKLPYNSTIQTLRKVARENGVKTLYEGFLPYYLRCGGHTVSMFVFVQMMRDAYAKYSM
mmetsp:Transcript_19506/g.30099  ORF Transcript_19506/g.30099 Transcript_19506/m.30099 type:complete len:317 (-) Transcript_19506:1896-2846(-)